MQLASPFSWRAQLRTLALRIQNPASIPEGCIWIHSASLGEFEQARPIIEQLRFKFPTKKLVLTFYSASGYEVRKNYHLADYVYYMPFDTPNAANSFIHQINPHLAIFVKYDLWYFHLNALKNRSIPVLLISAIFHPNQIYFRWYGGFFREILHMCNAIFVQNEESERLLAGIQIKSHLANDTRFDRVLEIANEHDKFTHGELFLKRKNLIVAGSTWPADEQLLLNAFRSLRLKGYKLIIAPHVIQAERLQGLMELFQDFAPVLFSKCSAEVDPEVMIIDTLGDLPYIYRYAALAYVGGGFNKHVHNVLEAAVYGIPVFFGPKHHKSAEIADLLRLKLAWEVDSAAKLIILISELGSSKNRLKQLEEQLASYFKRKSGGTRVILTFLEQSFGYLR